MILKAFQNDFPDLTLTSLASETALTSRYWSFSSALPRSDKLLKKTRPRKSSTLDSFLRSSTFFSLVHFHIEVLDIVQALPFYLNGQGIGVDLLWIKLGRCTHIDKLMISVARSGKSCRQSDTESH